MDTPEPHTPSEEELRRHRRRRSKRASRRSARNQHFEKEFAASNKTNTNASLSALQSTSLFTGTKLRLAIGLVLIGWLLWQLAKWTIDYTGRL